MSLLHAGIAAGKPWAREGGRAYLTSAHRLDAEVSGVILLAKSKPVLTTLRELFGTEEPKREYVALVRGSPAEARFEIEAKLAPHPTRPGLMRADSKGGKRAHTICEVTERFAGYTLLLCQALTERPDQVRAHLRYAGFPIAGDGRYGGKPLLLSRLKSGYHLKPGHTERPLLSSPALHLQALALPHPVTGTPLSLGAPWPKDLSVAVKYLRRYAAGV